MSEPSPTTAAQLLREHIARDAPARESSVARFMLVACGLSGTLAFLLVPFIGAPLGGVLGVLLYALAAYYFTLLRMMRRGWFHPAVSWVNVAIEVSAPSLIFLIDARQGGPQYALTAPPLVIWGTLIALSGLRSNKWLSTAAGALAATEYALLYALVAWPRMHDETLVTLRPPLVATRVVLLFLSALLTVYFITHLNKRAEEALAAVRARDVFGKYLLHERLGMGGMAEVFRATYSPEGGFQKVVALKRVLPQYAEDEAFIAMFRSEAMLCSQFSHPCVVQVFDFGRFADTYFLAMEYLDGPPLSRVLRAHRGQGLPLPAVAHLAVSLLEGLQYVHERVDEKGQPLNLVHRDVNPPNVLLSRIGQVKLTDFGIARSASHLQFTEAGMVKGKPGYLAPEQAMGAKIDARVDLFALGITLWECVAGEQLFASHDQALMVRNTFEKAVPSLREKRPEVPEALEALILRLLERDLPRRAPSARAALQLLRGLDPAVMAGGARSLAAAVEFALNTTQASSPEIPAVARSVNSDAPTLPGR